MITKNNLVSGGICGIICVAFMWVYMHFAGMGSMDMGNKKMSDMMHQMPDGSMMMNHGAGKGTLMPEAMMDMTMRDMVTMMEGKTGKALEKEFIVGMIPHHQGAVEISKKLLEDKTISAEMKKFAEDIIRAQEGEIKMMNAWLKKY